MQIWVLIPIFAFITNKTNTMNYEIKITGSGTAKQIAAALRQVAKQIQEAADNIPTVEQKTLDGAKWEDPTLMTVIEGEGGGNVVEYHDKDGEPLEVGDDVIMPDPNGKDDAWNHSFVGFIDKFKDGYAIVVDAEDNAFSVEPNRLELDL